MLCIAYGSHRDVPDPSHRAICVPLPVHPSKQTNSIIYQFVSGAFFAEIINRLRNFPATIEHSECGQPRGNQPTPKMDRCRDRREHGDLLDLIHLHTGGAPLRRAIDEVLAFLSLPPSGPPMAAVTPPPQVALPPHQWHPCGSLPARPRHRPLPLPGPGISSQSHPSWR